MARSAKLIVALLLLVGVYFLFRTESKSFSAKVISSSLPPQPQWMIPPPTLEEKAELQAILSKPFTFLGEGAQAIAFQSADGKYVLKLFKMRRFTPSLLDQFCPHVVRRRYRNLNWVFNGYRNAFQDLRKETGLVWIHLAKTTDLSHPLTLIDREGNIHTLDANQTEFVLQEKAELIFDKLKRLYLEGKKEEAEQAIRSVLHLVQTRIAKGYADRDKAVSYNYGFVGDRPIQLDLGRLYKGQKEGQYEHVERRIERWKSEHAELLP